MNVLRTHNLSKRYRGRVALDNLSLEVERGQIFGLLGPNGAGKTTTIKILLGLIRPTGGTVEYFNTPGSHHDLDVRRRIGALVESPSFLGYLTGRRHLQILARLYGMVDQADVDRVLHTVELTRRADDKIRGFSLGMRQRLGIAQALLRRPEFLILDEPTNGLDPRGIADIRALLLRLSRERGVTIFVSSHMLAEVEQLCTHVGFVNQGRLLRTGKVADLVESGGGLVLFRTGDNARAKTVLAALDGVSPRGVEGDALVCAMNPADSARAAAALHAAGLAVHEVIRKRKTLEDVFLELIQESGDV